MCARRRCSDARGGPRRTPESVSRQVAALALRGPLRDPSRLAALDAEVAAG
jgi:hypothetical protein